MILPDDPRACSWTWQGFQCVAPPPPPSTLESCVAALQRPEILLPILVTALLIVATMAIFYAPKRRGTQPSIAVRFTRPPPDSRERRIAMLRDVPALRALGDPEIVAAVDALQPKTFHKGDVVYRQDSQGDDCYFVLAGECVSTSEVYTLEVGLRVNHKKHGMGTVAEVTENPQITKVVFDKGESHRYVPASLHKLKPVADVKPRVVESGRYRPNGKPCFGERALGRVEPRAKTVTCLTDVKALRLTAATFLELNARTIHKENLVRGLKFFETFSDDQITLLAGGMQPRTFKDGEIIYAQGDSSHHMHILDSGEAIAITITPAAQAEEGKRYKAGELFGEKALLDSSARTETITAVGGEVRTWELSRDAFEARLGSLKQLQAEQALADPRHLISLFYGKEDASTPALPPSISGPAGGAIMKDETWFAVYRPCSRDSIAKMLSGAGTGKGLNIKGKSAKKNRLSGFVPFCQISKNEDKAALEETPIDARTRLFFKTASARSTSRVALERTLVEMKVEKGTSPAKLRMDVAEVRIISEYEPDSYGLDVPEALLKEVYIMRADVSPVVGWETGRDSEPAFLDMNLHSLRDGASGATEPAVVLYQSDQRDPMNPLGLLMAYAEAKVTPVVSDFDTFLVGSKGVRYTEATPPKQVKLMNWSLKHATELIAEPNTKGWMGRWLNLLKEEAAKGFHPELPKYGFGDATSYGLIGEIVKATSGCGAVRHGAECFNFYFPQELDDEFLVVWDGLKEEPQPWKTVSEPELRQFLLERCKEGFSFPINPVWPIRDKGWYEVFQALQKNDEAASNLASWFPPDSGVKDKIEKAHGDYPEGFVVWKQKIRRSSYFTNISRDCDTREMADIAMLEVRKETQARWRRIRTAMKVYMLSQHE